MRTDGLGLRGPDERGDGRLGRAGAAETGLWDAHLDDLLQTFTGEVRHSGGADPIPPSWAGRCCCTRRSWASPGCSTCPPGWARLGPDTAAVTRFDPRIADDESMRAPLQLLSNVLNLWASHPLGEMLDAVSSR